MRPLETLDSTNLEPFDFDLRWTRLYTVLEQDSLVARIASIVTQYSLT